MITRFMLVASAALSLGACALSTDEPTERANESLDSFGSVGQGDEAWRKVRDCGWDTAVVDHNDGPCNTDRCTRGGVLLDYQLVIRDPNVIRYFNQEGVWPSRYGDDEIIVQGWRWPGSRPDQIRFRRLLDCSAPYNDCTWVDVYDDWDGVRVEFMHKTTYCTDLDPMEGCRGEWISGTVREADWAFWGCERS